MVQENEKSKVISFGLWGSDLKYWRGLVANLELARKYYPGWDVRVKMSTNNVGLWKRFEMCGDIMIVRDADSRLNARETDAVQEWLESDKGFHIMRDHKNHKAKMLGGMWGMRREAMPDFNDRLRAWVPQIGHNKRGPYWKEDMRFLKEVVWPVAKRDHMAHDDQKRITGQERPFRVKMEGFVGEQK